MSIKGEPLTESVDFRTILKRGLDNNPDELALSSLRSRWTWRELDETSDRLAKSYLDLGLKPGDRVASLMPNRCELMIHYIACSKAGLVLTPLNYRYMAPEIDHALTVSGASVLLAHDERAEDLAAAKMVPGLQFGVISYTDDGGTGDQSYGALSSRDIDTVTLPSLDLDDPCLIFFTSGSTGKPKGVSHTYRTFGNILASMIQSMTLTSDDVIMAGSSMSHAGGIFYTCSALINGTRAAVARTFDADELLPALRDLRPTIMFMLPSALFALVRDHGAVREDFSSIRLCVSGGDKVADALEEEYSHLAGHMICEIYGMSENGLATLNTEIVPGEAGAVGVPMAGYELEVRGEDGQPLGLDEPGRLWCKFAGNMVGYWDNPKATEETIVDGWLDTGDIMSLDAAGYLWFHGRKKQIIVHDGSNICPQEVEGSLLAHPAVEEAGVVGFKDLVHGENVRAYVVINPEFERPTQQDLIAFSRESVGYKAPEEIVELDEMPLNATGKVDRVTLKAMAAKEQA